MFATAAPFLTSPAVSAVASGTTLLKSVFSRLRGKPFPVLAIIYLLVKEKGTEVPLDYTYKLSTNTSYQEGNRYMLTVNNTVPVGGVRQVLPGSRAGDSLGPVASDYRAGEAVTKRMQQPGLTGPQGFNATTVTTRRFAFVFQRVRRVALAVTDSTVTEDDGDELTARAGADYGHAVVNNHAVALVSSKHGVVIGVADEVDKLLFTCLRIYEAVHRDSAQHFTAVAHQRITHSLGSVDERARVEAQGGGHVHYHVVLLVVCVGSGYVVVVQTERGSNQTALCLTLPEVIQTGRYGLQRVLAGQFNSQIRLAETFVQISHANIHLTGLHVTWGGDILIHIVRVVRFDRGINRFPVRQNSFVGRAVCDSGGVRSRGKDTGLEERGFLYRVLCHVGQDYRFFTSYDIADSSNCHYFFLRALSCRSNSAGFDSYRAIRSASLMSLNAGAAPPPLLPEAPPPEAAFALIKCENALCSRRYLRNCSGSVVITLPSAPTNLVTTSSPSNSVLTNGARMSTASGVIKSPAKEPNTALRSLPRMRSAILEMRPSFSANTGSYWLRIVFSNSSILPAAFSASWCAR
nr:MAG TPA: hypothetical protein [Caudoviricetes sp.]